MTSELPKSFLQFLRGCRTHDPAYAEPRCIPVEWEYVTAISDVLTHEDRIIVVKSRQMMVSWLGCAWLLHRALTSGPGIHVVLSKEERSAKELIERVRILLESLPETWLHETGYRTSGGSIAFSPLRSRILSLPAAPYAVRGLSPRSLFWDEMAYTPNDEEIWTAVKPAVDSGGAFLGVSTPNGPNGVFYRLAHDDSGQFHVHNIDYRMHPERREEEWLEKARAGLSEERWRREQELSFEGAEGRVYDQFTRKRHLVDESFEPGIRSNSRLYRGIDFGYRHPAVIWAEELQDGSLVVFDCLLGDRWPFDLLMDKIRAVDRHHHLREKDFTWTAVDPAGKAKDDFGLSPISALEEAGFKIRTRHSLIAWGLEKVRSLLLDANGRVRLTIHPRCEELIRSFDGYMYDEEADQPAKDGIHDHLMDALRYLVINLPRFHRPEHTRQARVAGFDPPWRSR